MKLTAEERLEQEVIESLGAPTQDDIITWAENAEIRRYELNMAKAERRRKEAAEKFERELKIELAIARRPERVVAEVPTVVKVKVKRRGSVWDSDLWDQFKYTMSFLVIGILALFMILGPQMVMQGAEVLGQTIISIRAGYNDVHGGG